MLPIMPRKSSYARISITLPREVLAAADRRAKELDRPRSWVIAEAIRSYRSGAPNPAVAPAGAEEVAAARRQHLLADLRLTPEERLRRAAALLRLAPGSGTRRRAQVIGFDSYEDFDSWKRARRVEALNRS
jgi:predicted transcriptional regulator